MKKTIAVFLCLALCLSMAACGGTSTGTADNSTADSESASEPITLKIGYGIADTTTMGKAVQSWADAVTDATDGRIKFEIYPSGQLGTMVEMIEAVELGQLDISLSDASLMCETVPQLNLLALPMLIKDYNGWKKLTQSEVGDQLKDLVAENSNIYVMGWMFNGFRNILSAKEVQSLEDCEGIIIRSPEADIYIQTLQRLNFTPTPLSFSDVYTALQTGVVQACETSYEQFITNSFYEVAKHMIESNHMAASMSIIINQEIWDSIGETDQQAMQELYGQIMSQCNDQISKEGDGFKNQLLNDYGCDLYAYTDAEQQELVSRFTDYWSKNASANGYEDLLEQAVAMR